ncbi:MAG: 5-formyltetrahydrofolate cyclo-ligase [Pelagibacterales bacterium]|nr:5-formyltetrahydrofolate cyclo-ligase [Pelagibacterales bacterium]
MKYDKAYLRNQFILQRKKKYLTSNKINFNFDLIFSLIRKHFNLNKVTIAGYCPSNYEVNILTFLQEAAKKKYKIALPVIKTSTIMEFKSWIYKESLYVSKFGTLEPKKSNNELVPDFFLVPLVAFDEKLNRIGYGKGYYDRILKKISKNKKKIISIGIAYSFQKCRIIPTNKHDFRLDYIFTERGIINSNK